MKTILSLMGLLLMAVWVSAAEDDEVRFEQDPNTRYLDKGSLETLFGKLENLQYPLTRSEAMSQLGLADRELPSLRITASKDQGAAYTGDQEDISLTDPTRPGRRYILLLWYDPAVRHLSGEAFIKAKVVNYAEVLVRDDGREDWPKATYVLQSDRYPYVRLEYPKPATAHSE